MAKKKRATRNAPNVTFEVCFEAPHITPEAVPLRSFSDALAAVQDLAAGRDPFETSHVPPEKVIGLVEVQEGSAVYQCVARAPDEALTNLRHVNRILSIGQNGDAKPDEETTDFLVASLRPIEALSEIAKRLQCEVKVRVNRNQPLFTVGSKDYKRISTHLLIEGETSVVGEVLRVGGATKNRCLLRVPGRHRGLYCDVATRDLARKLGEHIYETVVAQGTAKWIHSSWRIVSFQIKSFTQPKVSNTAKVITELRKAGFDAWDKIDDPETFLREVNS
jgi:hypothetical protein